MLMARKQIECTLQLSSAKSNYADKSVVFSCTLLPKMHDAITNMVCTANH